MDFALTPEQIEIQRMVRSFAEEKIAAAQVKMDEDHAFPYQVWEQWSELGMAGMIIPEEYGGAGMDTLTYIIAMEEVARVSNTFALIWQVHLLAANVYKACASEALKAHYLTAFAKGEKLGSFGLTEPGAGSDASGIQTRAALNGNEWIINGSKTFISNAGTDISDGLVLIAASGDKDLGRKEISCFAIPRDAPGYSLGQSWEKIAWHGMSNNELVFEDCRIPKDNLIGVRGGGLRQALGALNVGRIVFGCVSGALVQAVLEASLSYAKERKQFGEPLSSFQLIQAKLADLATNAEAIRHFVRYVAWLHAQGVNCSKEAAMVKLFASRLATQATLEGFQIHGGYGFMTEYAVNRYFREGKILEVGEGTNEIQQLLIARELGC